MMSEKINTKVVCDGVRIDKNIIPAYLQQVQSGATSYSVESAYYSGPGRTCQSGLCGKTIHNVFIVKDNVTGNTYEIGCECVKKYDGLESLIGYWKRQLEQAKGRAIREAKRRARQEDKRLEAKQSQVDHASDLEFIDKYLDLRPSPFLETIKKCFMNGWSLTEKQAEVFDTIKRTTDFDELMHQVDKAIVRFDEVLQVIEILDRVNFGMYPSQIYSSIRAQFARTGSISDAQLDTIKKILHRFRRQV